MQTDKYVYNAWGKVVSSAGSTVNPYKYVGRLGYYSDSGTGLLSLGVRFYDPEAGVFTQRDAAKDGLSYYAYTSGKVMTAVDPWGLLRWPPGQKEKCPNYDKARDIIIKALEKPSCRSFFQSLGCTLGGSNDPFLKGQGPRMIVADPKWTGWGPDSPDGKCGCNDFSGPRQGDIMISSELCQGTGNSDQLARTWIHESSHWCLCRAKGAGMPRVRPSDGGGSFSSADPFHSGEGYAAERACFGGVVF